MPTDEKVKAALEALADEQLAKRECFGGAAAGQPAGAPRCENYDGDPRF